MLEILKNCKLEIKDKLALQAAHTLNLKLTFAGDFRKNLGRDNSPTS
jgi:hypothetical protein